MESEKEHVFAYETLREGDYGRIVGVRIGLMFGVDLFFFFLLGVISEEILHHLQPLYFSCHHLRLP